MPHDTHVNLVAMSMHIDLSHWIFGRFFPGKLYVHCHHHNLPNKKTFIVYNKVSFSIWTYWTKDRSQLYFLLYYLVGLYVYKLIFNKPTQPCPIKTQKPPMQSSPSGFSQLLHTQSPLMTIWSFFSDGDSLHLSLFLFNVGGGPGGEIVTSLNRTETVLGYRKFSWKTKKQQSQSFIRPLFHIPIFLYHPPLLISSIKPPFPLHPHFVSSIPPPPPPPPPPSCCGVR